jgi:hypothetical protein
MLAASGLLMAVIGNGRSMNESAADPQGEMEKLA